jgi:hypothetical protein
MTDGKTFQPAKGLRVLTWPQIERIDEIISKLCQQTQNGNQARLTIIVKNGKLRFAEKTLSMELRPNRE